MNRTVLIARREFLAVVVRRAFWIAPLLSLLAMLISIGASFFAARSAPGSQGYAYLLLDRSGHYQAAILQRAEADYQLHYLQQLAVYEQRRKIVPPHHWGNFPETIGEAELDAFIKDGGIKAAVAELTPLLPPKTTPFAVSPSWFQQAFMPGGLNLESSEAEFTAVVDPLFEHPLDTAEGPRPLGLAIYIPADGTAPKIWVNQGNQSFLAKIEDTILRVNRETAWRVQGVDAADVAKLDPASLPQRLVPPPVKSVAVANLGRGGIGSALFFIGYIVVAMTGGMLLQAVREERSGRLLESLLSCVTPGELLRGKLIGMAAVAGLLVVVWVSLLFAITALLHIPVPWGLIGSPLTVLRIVFYLTTGYLIYATLYLVVGAMADSAQDAAPFQVPLMMLLMPLLLVMSIAITNPDAKLFAFLAWVPIYTPFVMMTRIGSPIGGAELLGTSVLIVVFLAGELVLVGRIFQGVLLRTGNPLKWRDLWRLMGQISGV